MRRREVLAAGGALTSSLVGCLGGGSSGGPRTQTSGGGSATPRTEVSIPSPTGECGTAVTPQSDQFVVEGGEARDCFGNTKAPLAIENERDAETAVEVDIAVDGQSVFSESYALSPDERVVERGVLPAHGEHTATVTIDGRGPVTGRWEGMSCYRHGVSILSEGVEFGLVPPLSGPGDGQHDCYAGDSVDVMVRNTGEPRTVTVYVVDHCSERVHERTLTVRSDEVERVRDVLSNGGVYDVIIDIEGGASATYEFYDECWGIAAGIDEDGDVDVHQMFID